MTEPLSILKTSLLDLLHGLEGQNVPLMLGGGYGLYLKQLHLQDAPRQSALIDGDLWPRPRATEDLDILLRTEVVVDVERMAPIRDALDRLGYKTIAGAEYMQFVRPLPGGMHVKVDLLTGPREAFAGDPRVRVDERRVRLRESVKLHAHPTDEALAFEDDTMSITVEGVLSSGEPWAATVEIPSAFTLLLMKLFAFRDRCKDEEKDLGRHHALDLYRIVAMMSDAEWQRTVERIEEFTDHPIIVEARRIVTVHFGTPESLGSLRLREHLLWDEAMALNVFLSALADLFGEPHT